MNITSTLISGAIHIISSSTTPAKNFSSREIKRVHNVDRKPDVNLHPNNAAPLQYYKATEIDIERAADGRIKRMYPTTGFVSHFGDTGEPALVVHGILAGRHRFFTDRPPINDLNKPTIPYDTKEFKKRAKTPASYVDHLKERHSIDLRKESENKRLHLISCYSGGADGSAQRLADALGTTVLGYVDGQTEVLQDPLDNLLGNALAFVGKRVDSEDVRTTATAYEPRAQTNHTSPRWGGAGIDCTARARSKPQVANRFQSSCPGGNDNSGSTERHDGPT